MLQLVSREMIQYLKINTGPIFSIAGSVKLVVRELDLEIIRAFTEQKKWSINLSHRWKCTYMSLWVNYTCLSAWKSSRIILSQSTQGFFQFYESLSGLYLRWKQKWQEPLRLHSVIVSVQLCSTRNIFLIRRLSIIYMKILIINKWLIMLVTSFSLWFISSYCN